MRLPRDLSGSALIRKLEKLGYRVTRQSGSHIRLSTQDIGKHHITIPNHSPLRIGTLATILADVATHLTISRDDLMERLFRKQ